MSPNPDYELGQEHNAGKQGNVPFLLYHMLPFDLVFAALPITAAFHFFRVAGEVGLLEVVVGFIGFMGISSLILLLLHVVQRRRGKNPVENQELRSILDRAARRMQYEDEVEIWMCSADGPVLTSLSTFLFKTIVVSESTISDILANPSDGEVAMANALMKLSENRSIGIKFPVFIMAFLLTVFSFWGAIQPDLKSILAYFLLSVFILAQFNIELRGRARKYCPVLEEYGVHPDKALITLFRGTSPNTEEEQGIKDKIAKHKKEPRERMTTIVLFSSSLVLTLILTSAIYQLILVDRIPSFLVFFEIDLFVPLLVFLVLFEVIFWRMAKFVDDRQNHRDDVYLYDEQVT